MGHVSYVSHNKIYTLQPLTLTYLPKLVGIIANYLLDCEQFILDKQEYTQLLKKAINEGFAYVCFNSKSQLMGAFCYIKNPDNTANAVTLYFLDKVTEVLLLLKGSMTKLHYLRVYPHHTNYKTFKSLVTPESIRKYNRGITDYVTIKNIKVFHSKFLRLYRLLQIRKV
jgi:hypothetical protein